MLNTIYISHRNDWIIPFMYYPVIYSLLSLVPIIFTNKKVVFNLNENIYETLIEGDIYIWVGDNTPNFLDIKQKNVYTIHYNLEPYILLSNSDEIWTYSLYLYDLYKINNTHVKFIPIIHNDTLPKTKYLENNNSLELTFIGNLSIDNRIEKEKIINNSGVKINQIYNLWTDDDFNNYINNNTHIYLNITKSNTKALATVRINKLLSHKCIIISEYTNIYDEEIYKGIVFFKHLSEIGDFYKTMKNKSNDELDCIAESVYQKYINIFNKENAIKLIKEYVIK
jgi:hypothetical protein